MQARNIVYNIENILMNIEVEYKAGNGLVSNHTYFISRLALLKHFGMAGQGYGTFMRNIRRAIGMYFQYADFFGKIDLVQSRFGQSAEQFYDPTEISDFSTIAGKGIADFLAKRIDKATHTVTYEAAMVMKGHSLKNGSRPDLYCFNSTRQFAVESKGFSQATVSDSEMIKHKLQSAQGPLSCHFSVASVSFNMYKQIKNKYHDPINDNVGYDIELNSGLSKQFYAGFAPLFDNTQYIRNIRTFNTSYYLFPLFDPQTGFLLNNYRYRSWNLRKGIYLLLNTNIREYAINGNIEDQNPPYLMDDDIYIDNDGIGLLKI